jgi:transcriptional regulator with XRE-family HTH domain
MEFNEKLQKLRKQKGLTQEELATNLYVSRTAISKWEAGRGYPNIDSLKAIADFFSVTVDKLLSPDEILTIAEADNKRKETHFRDLIYGLLDISIAMLFFLPFFARNLNGEIQSVSLIMLDGVQPYLKIVYITVVSLTVSMGILTLALQNWQAMLWLKCKSVISLALGAVSILLFIISQQPYPAVFAFALLAIKVFIRIK